MRPTRITLLAALVAVAALAVACGDDDDGGDGDAAEPGAQVVEVSIVDFAFEPAEIAVPVGTTVRWVNEGAATHTVTGGPLDSGEIPGGDDYEATLVAPGTVEYRCTIHPRMQGTVIVEE